MNTRSRGAIGENIACVFLERKGYAIIARNYLKKWGELDIVAEKDKILHFVEVKSVTGTSYRPEENVHDLKLKKIRRMIQTYLAEKGIVSETEFCFHVICVFMNEKTRKARVKWIKDVIL